MSTESYALEQVRAALAGIEHVDRAVVDEATRTVVLVCSNPVARERVQDAARAALESSGLSGAEWTVEITVPIESRERRVRFLGVNREQRRDNQIEIEVSLEYGGQVVNARTLSERGEALELRAVATASLDALRPLVDAGLDVRIGGVKRTRSFDADLMVASLYRPGPPPQQFVGAVLVGNDPYRAASLAVLSALNRHLGNYLSRM